MPLTSVAPRLDALEDTAEATAEETAEETDGRTEEIRDEREDKILERPDSIEATTHNVNSDPGGTREYTLGGNRTSRSLRYSC